MQIELEAGVACLAAAVLAGGGLLHWRRGVRRRARPEPAELGSCWRILHTDEEIAEATERALEYELGQAEAATERARRYRHSLDEVAMRQAARPPSPVVQLFPPQENPPPPSSEIA